MNPISVRVHALSALFAAAAVWLPAVNVAAQDCASGGAECAAGYRCQTESYESCGGEITCTPDGECTESDGGCSPFSYSYCTNAICDEDADCPSTMACRAQTTWQCSGSGSAGAGGGGAVGGAGGGDDGMQPADGGVADEPYDCVEVPADSLCIPRYELPCTVASDCGGGFDCVQSTGWECSGSGAAGAGSPRPPVATGGMTGGGTSDGGTSDGDADGGVGYPDYECHEVPGTDYYCQLQDLPCTATAECPEGLECLDQYIWTCDGSGTGGAAAAGAGGAAAGGTGGGMASPPSTDGDADAGVDDGSSCTSLLQQRCMPPGWNSGPGFPPGGGSGDSGGSEDGGISEGPGSGSGSAGTGSSGSGGAGGAGGASGGEGEEPGEDEDDSHGNGHSHGDRGNHFGWLKLGCSAGGSIGSDPSGWLALGLTVLALRRRARKLS